MNCIKPFHFKQFSICQDQTAMKIGTDGVLLGAWATAEKPIKILDIGTGTGIIALMLAQRFTTANIDAIEIDKLAFEQAKNNFNNSDFSKKIKIYNIALQNFTPNKLYDLIVCNPPFFDENVPAKNKNRQIARQNIKLNLVDIFLFVNKYLKKNGSFNMIFPKTKEQNLIDISKQFQLHLNHKTIVRGNPNSDFKRILCRFTKQKKQNKTNILTIETSRHNHTKEYTQLTKDFYL